MMPALNFKKQFAPQVESGEKRQTVRAHRKDSRAHCKAGDTLKLYTGMRTKGCRLLAEATVTSVQKVEIFSTSMKLNDRVLFGGLSSRDADITDNEFAEADGFESFMDMAAWFDDVHGLPFEGVVIKWSDPK